MNINTLTTIVFNPPIGALGPARHGPFLHANLHTCLRTIDKWRQAAQKARQMPAPGRKGSPEDGGKDTPGNHRLPVDQREGQLRLQDHGGGLDEMLSET